MKGFALVMVLLTGGILIYGIQDMPGWGDPHSPAHLHVAVYYLKNSLKDTGTPNVVTSVLADYREYDTLGETTVIFAAGVACLLLLRKDAP